MNPQKKFHLVFSLLMGAMMIFLMTFVITAVNVGFHANFLLTWARAFVIAYIGVIVFFLQIDTLPQKNSSRDKHLQNRLSETPCAFGAD